MWIPSLVPFANWVEHKIYFIDDNETVYWIWGAPSWFVGLSLRYCLITSAQDEKKEKKKIKNRKKWELIRYFILFHAEIFSIRIHLMGKCLLFPWNVQRKKVRISFVKYSQFYGWIFHFMMSIVCLLAHKAIINLSKKKEPNVWWARAHVANFSLAG